MMIVYLQILKFLKIDLLILCSESIFSLGIGTEAMLLCFRLVFVNSYFQCIRLTRWHRPRGSFKLNNETIILWHFRPISGFLQICINKTFLPPTFILKRILCVSLYFILKTSYLIIRSKILIFVI